MTILYPNAPLPKIVWRFSNYVFIPPSFISILFFIAKPLVHLWALVYFLLLQIFSWKVLNNQLSIPFKNQPEFGSGILIIFFVSSRPRLLMIFLHHIDGISPSIKFTVEIEENRSLTFLDVRVSRSSDNTL